MEVEMVLLHLVNSLYQGKMVEMELIMVEMEVMVIWIQQHMDLAAEEVEAAVEVLMEQMLE